MSGGSTIPVTLTDVLRYRLHYGANLGSVFVLERWLSGSMYTTNTTGESELAAVQGWVASQGLDATRQRFEQHWTQYISDNDLDWLKNTGKCNTVRVPIGYFTLGQQYCNGTPFQAVAPVYVNAWVAVRSLVQRCRSRGIGVLLDFHALPGGANTGIHSGTDSGKAELWTSTAYLNLAKSCLGFIAQAAKSMDGVVGIQLVNEAITNAPGIYPWYDSVLSSLSQIDSTMPIYISDGWNLTQALSYVQQKNCSKTLNTCPVVIDTHCYWCFSDADKAKTAQTIISQVPQCLCELDNKDGNVVDRGAAQVFIGEYSCVLDGSTWQKSASSTQSKTTLVNQFGQAQNNRFFQQAGGCCFWTYRMDWMNGGEWGISQMASQGAVAPPSCFSLTSNDITTGGTNARNQQAQRRQNSVSAHCQYWDTNFPGPYQHWRFEQGWNIGYCDALAFFEMRSKYAFAGADKIGMLDLWVLKRLRESDQSSSYTWEFEQGLRQGVQDLYSCVGLSC